MKSLNEAMTHALRIRPRVGGFPYLAEALRRAGVTRNVWTLPACQSLYFMRQGTVVSQGEPLVAGTVDVPAFDREALVRALRRDQAGDSTFSEFLTAAWDAGVVAYDVDFERRTVTYRGAGDETYTESYAAVDLDAAGS